MIAIPKPSSVVCTPSPQQAIREVSRTGRSARDWEKNLIPKDLSTIPMTGPQKPVGLANDPDPLPRSTRPEWHPRLQRIDGKSMSATQGLRREREQIVWSGGTFAEGAGILARRAIKPRHKVGAPSATRKPAERS